MEKKSCDKKGPHKYLLPGFLLLGIGVGLAINKVAAGTLIGLGIGFMAMYIAAKKK